MFKIIVTDLDGSVLDDTKRRYNCLMKVVGDRVSKKEFKESYWVKDILSEEDYEKFLKLFQSSELLGLDEPARDAKEVVQWFFDNGFAIFYLTARLDTEEFAMKKGTLEWLKFHGFPYPDSERVFLSMKKDRTVSDKDFKLKAIMETKRIGFALLGVGDNLHDAIAYNHVGAKPFIFKKKYNKGDKFPPGTQLVTNWEAVRKWAEENI